MFSRHKNLSRRRFLQTAPVIAAIPSLLPTALAAETRQAYYLSAAGNRKESYSLRWIQAQSETSSILLSGFRGHSAIQHGLRRSHALMFGRRPATQCIEVNLESGRLEKIVSGATNRHFYGHGVFGSNGKELFTTENALDRKQGCVVIRDALSYQVLDEYELQAIGPHEIRLMPDGKTLAVAVGGILTHPDSGRKKLNLDTMHSSLVFMDSASGQVLEQFRVNEPKASIRHLDVAPDGTVAIAMQVQRKATGHNATRALGAVLKPGGGLKLLDGPDAVLMRMNDYAGSVAINPLSRVVGLTSPRGNLAAFWQLNDGEFLGYHAFHDVCGITISQDQKEFVLSNSGGQIRHLNAWNLKENRDARLSLRNVQWDNHLSLAVL